MGRTAGVPNKITLEVKEKLQLLIDDLKTSLGVNELDANHASSTLLDMAWELKFPKLIGVKLTRSCSNMEDQILRNS
jgi:hypothetical protein